MSIGIHSLFVFSCFCYVLCIKNIVIMYVIVFSIAAILNTCWLMIYQLLAVHNYTHCFIIHYYWNFNYNNTFTQTMLILSCFPNAYQWAVHKMWAPNKEAKFHAITCT